jgi:hypothetical protein
MLAREEVWIFEGLVSRFVSLSEARVKCGDGTRTGDLLREWCGIGCAQVRRTILGSPSFSILVLKTNELGKYLVVARCTEMCLRMHRVPRIFPIANPRELLAFERAFSRVPRKQLGSGSLSMGSSPPADPFCGGLNTTARLRRLEGYLRLLRSLCLMKL